MNRSKLYFKRTDKSSVEIMEVFLNDKRTHIVFNPHKHTTFKLSEETSKSWVNYETLNYVVVIPKVNPRKKIIYPDTEDLEAIITLVKVSKSKLVTFKVKPLERFLSENLSKTYYSFLPFKNPDLSLAPFLIVSPTSKKVGALKRLLTSSPTSFMQGISVELINHNLFVIDRALPVVENQEILFDSKLKSFDFLVSISVLDEKERQVFGTNFSDSFISSDELGEWILLKDVV